jgi:hypothetical protein
MAFSDWEKAMYAYIVGRTLPKGTTRMAAKATLAAAVQAGRAISPYAARAAPPLARAAYNPYIGVPLAAGAAGYMLQEEIERSGLQEEVNVARDEFIAALQPTAVKTKKRIKSTYNKAVSKAMKAVKASTKGGPKGTISNARKTFGTVSKAVSKARKGGKLSPKGVTGVVKRALTGVFKKPRGKPKRRTSGNGYTVRKL